MMELFGGLREVPNVHMVVVHFPIALLPVAFGLDALGWLFGARSLQDAGRWTLWIGTLAAGAAVWSGIEGADDVHPYVTDAAEALMDVHMKLQFGTLGAAIALSAWRLAARPFPVRGAFVYLLVSAAMVANLAVASDFGGQMVFVHGVAVQVDADSLQGSAEKGHAHHHHLFGGGEEEEHEHPHHDHEDEGG
jgi:uncharacterized membrane protein